ncbi:hypothetical protein E6C60_0493 [Paenibacillus algicola]|uniref:Uncharacterized protein n=1 Tax=Paenibacillus algicola TaxID=2565926 RepID=A0A4P8XFP3_9BACL|nr:hypothetical protein E6C60_0493 [Paenibacillus algicola]
MQTRWTGCGAWDEVPSCLERSPFGICWKLGADPMDGLRRLR